MPALLHFPTASGTAARGGSIMDMRPTKHRFSVGKFVSSVSNWKPSGNCSSGKKYWQNPGSNNQMLVAKWLTLNIRLFIFFFLLHYPILSLQALRAPGKHSGKLLSSPRPGAELSLVSLCCYSGLVFSLVLLSLQASIWNRMQNLGSCALRATF